MSVPKLNAVKMSSAHAENSCQSCGGPRRERFGHQFAKALMLSAFQAQQDVHDLLVEGTGCDALSHQVDARRGGEAGVAQDGAGEFVGQHLRPQRADRDRPLAPGVLELAPHLSGRG